MDRKVSPEDLRASILQAAIQGKLVPQDPNDEPASILLERIREEKHRLVKEGKIKKDKHESFIFCRDNHYYENINGEETVIDDQLPFDIPSSWSWSRLSDIAIVIMGQSPVGSSVTNDKTGVEFHQGKSCFTEKELSKSDTFTSAPTKLIDFEAILMSVRAPVGDINFVSRKICIGRGLCAIKPLIDMQYTFTYLSTLKKWLESKATGSTFKAINVDLIKSVLIPVPPENEQLRILLKIFELESKIDDYLLCNIQLETIDSEVVVALRNAVLQFAIQGNLVPQDPNESPVQIQCKNPIVRRDNSYYEVIAGREICIDEELVYNDIPTNWSIMRLGDIVSLTSGRDLTPDQYNDENRGIPYITGASNILDNHIEINRWTEKPITIAKEGDILITCKGTIGAICVVKGIGRVHIARQIMSIRPIVPEMRDFIELYLRAIVMKIKSKKHGTIPGISREDILSLIIAIPPLEEQVKIVNKVNILISTLDNLNVI